MVDAVYINLASGEGRSHFKGDGGAGPDSCSLS